MSEYSSFEPEESQVNLSAFDDDFDSVEAPSYDEVPDGKYQVRIDSVRLESSQKDASGNVTVERVLRTKPHPTYEAGDRTGRLPELLPLDYQSFVKAFNSPARSQEPGNGGAAKSSTPVSGEIKVSGISEKLKERLAFTFEEDGTFRSDDFYNLLYKKFDGGHGYYGWTGLRYFLYEYELSLLSASRQKKVGWNDLLKTSKDRISIEHVYPQTPGKPWAEAFKGVKSRDKVKYAGSLGNMLLLSASVNSALQNDGFDDKKHPKHNEEGEKVRNGFSDGSHSEIEVSKLESWGPQEIRDRGIKLLKFMEKRWGLQFANAEGRDSMLFLPE